MVLLMNLHKSLFVHTYPISILALHSSMIGQSCPSSWWGGFTKIQENDRFDYIISLNLQLNIEMTPSSYFFWH
jgi:hypothetical protein